MGSRNAIRTQLRLRDLQKVSDQIVARLFRQYEGSLRRHLLSRMSLIPDDCDDVVQETFIRIMRVEERSEGRVENMESPKAYIFRTATNLAIDHIRRSKNRADGKDGQGLADKLESGCPAPDRVVYGEQRIEQLFRVIGELPPKCRRVFLLHKFKHMSYKQVAAHLQISQSMVEKHMMKALAYCFEHMNEDD